MTFRLSHVLALMLLLLLAGVASVGYLEARSGGAAVPGLVLVDAPVFDQAALDELASQWSGRGAARRELVVAQPGVPLAPFESRFVRRVMSRGDVTALFTLDPAFGRPEAARLGGWQAVLDSFPALGGELPLERLVAAGAEFVRSQSGTRAFLGALVLDPRSRDVPDLEPLIEALERLPDYRRSSLVVLGRGRGEVRPVLRLDLGRWGGRARPVLADLLELAW
ncbi:MAG: hypothetical protein H6825_06470 [Planctomycetes bacterium]|nr:hypothetical protein [Planctomycetota bacterium]